MNQSKHWQHPTIIDSLSSLKNLRDNNATLSSFTAGIWKTQKMQLTVWSKPTILTTVMMRLAECGAK